MHKIVLSPHIDDAILSLGGSIINWINSGYQVQVINIFSKSITYKKLCKISGDDNLETTIRKKDESEIAYEIGNIFNYWDLPSNGCRMYGRFRKYLPLKYQIRLESDKKVFIEIIKKFKELFGTNVADIYIPLAPKRGGHIDHIIVREAAVYVANHFPANNTFWLYEDMPYCARDKTYLSFIMSNNLSEMRNNVSFSDRERLSLKYKSHVLKTWIEDMRQYYNAIQCERTWKILGKIDTKSLGYNITMNASIKI